MSGKKSFPYEYLIVVSLCAISFGPIAFCLSCSGIFYTPVAADIGSSPATMSYFITMVTIPMVLILAPMGKLFDKVDCRIIMTASVGLIVVSFVLMSFINAAWQFLTLAFVIGFGLTSCVYLAPPVLINRWFSKRAGFFVGMVMAFTGVGGVVWAPVGGILIAQIGWRATYLVFAALTAVIGLPFTIFVLRNRPSDVGRQPYGYVPASEAALESATEGAAESADAAASSSESYESQGISAQEAFKMPSFFLLAGFALFFPLAVYIYGMIPSYVATLPVSDGMPLLGAVASSCAMATSIVAKMLWGALGEKNLVLSVAASAGLAIAGILVLWFVPGPWLLICIAAAAYGMVYGEQTVFCPIATRRFFGMRSYSELYSKISIIICIGVIAGTFGGGTILNLTGSYPIMFAYIIIMLAVSVVFIVLGERARRRV